MRKSYLFLMVLAGAMIGLPGCSLGGALGSTLIDGGISLLISLLWSVIGGSLTTPAA
jgi:hypothetical protein